MTTAPSGDLGFWGRVFSAVQRAIALGIFILVHYGLNRALAFVVPPNMVGALLFAQDVIFVIFILVYVYLAWEILTAFLPRLKVAGTAKPELEPHDES
jgi:hypothetical protein